MNVSNKITIPTSTYTDKSSKDSDSLNRGLGSRNKAITLHNKPLDSNSKDTGSASNFIDPHNRHTPQVNKIISK